MYVTEDTTRADPATLRRIAADLGQAGLVEPDGRADVERPDMRVKPLVGAQVDQVEGVPGADLRALAGRARGRKMLLASSQRASPKRSRSAIASAGSRPRSARGIAARIEALVGAPDDGVDKRRSLALLMAEILTPPGHLLAEFELCLLAVRRPEQRAATRRWKEALAAFARAFTDDPLRVKLFTQAYDGLLLQGLLDDEPPTADEFEELLRELLPDPAAGGDS